MVTYFYKVEKDCVFYKRYFLVKNEYDTRRKCEEKFFEENGLRKELYFHFCKRGKEFKLFVNFNDDERTTYEKHIIKKSLNNNPKEIKPSSPLFKSYWNMVVRYVDFELIWQFETDPLSCCGKLYNYNNLFKCIDVDEELYVEAENWYDLPDYFFIRTQVPEDKRVRDWIFCI